MRSVLIFSAWIALGLVPGAAAAAESPPPLKWTFPANLEPFTYEISLTHEEREKKNVLRTALDLFVRMTLESVTRAGEGVWTVEFERLKAVVSSPLGVYVYDSREKKEEFEHPPEVKPYAFYRGKKIRLTVSRAGTIRKLQGCLSGLPKSGSLDIGPDPEEDRAKSLFLELLAVLFHLPTVVKKKSEKVRQIFCYALSELHDAVGSYTVHLARETRAKKPSKTRHKGLSCTRLSWTDRIFCPGISVQSSGGSSVIFPRGYTGKGKGSAKLCLMKGIVTGLAESFTYVLPAARGPVQFRREIKVDFGGFVKKEGEKKKKK
jgi:hypothetical protein